MSSVSPILHALRWNPNDPLEVQADEVFAPTKMFSLACLLVGLVINCFNLGIYTMMLFTYLKRKQRDRLWIQLILSATTILNVAVVVYWIYWMWYLFVKNFGLYAPFIEVYHLSWFPVMDALASSIVQSFFAYRAWRLNNRNWWIAGISAVLITGSFVGAMYNHFLYLTVASELEAHKIRVPVFIWISCLLAADILITVTIAYGLYKTRTGWSYTDKMITKLVRMCFLTQLPPTLLTIFFICEYIIQPWSFLGPLIIGVQTSLYAIGLLYSLNSRFKLAPTNVTLGNTTTFQGGGPATGDQAIQVDVTTDVFETYKARKSNKSINRPGVLDKTGSLSEAEMGFSHAGIPGLDTIPDMEEEKAETTLVNDASTKSLDRDADVHVLEVSTSGSDNTSAHAASDRL